MVENEPSHTPAPPRPSRFGWPEALIWGGFLGAAGSGVVALAISDAEIWTLDYWGEDRSAVLRNLGLLIFAMPALWLAWRRTSTATKQAAISERGLQIDRYQKGAQMLESDELSVRIAGIYGLRELAISDPDESYIIVQSLLFALIRERSKNRTMRAPAPKTADTAHRRYEDLSADAYEALNATKSLRQAVPNAKHLEETHKWHPDLESANLSGAELWAADLSDADLNGANLSYAILCEANLSGTRLFGSDLSGADIRAANLSDARLFNASLSGAILEEANLSKTRLHSVNLSGANLEKANLSKTRLHSVNLSGANLEKVNLSSARFTDIVTDDRTNFDLAWAWADRPTIVMPSKIVAAITFRDPAERAEND